MNKQLDLLKKILRSKMPDKAVDYCAQLWSEQPFQFKITKSRKTKAGDFRFNPRTRAYTITLNHDLNPYNFLITYIHEVAHLKNHQQYQHHVPPHGPTWKKHYQTLMVPLLIPEVFPEALLPILKDHFKNPKAATYSDVRLVTALRQYDNFSEHEKEMISLDKVAEGQVFKFHDRFFKKGNLRRTRVLCKDIKNGKKYLIPHLALVKIMASED